MSERLRALACSTLWLVFGLTALSSLPGQATTYSPGKIGKREDRELFLTPPSQEGVRDGYWKVQEGIELFYLAEGSGPPLLFLHGGPGFPPDRLPEGLRPLAQGRRVYCYHQRGCGKSTRPFDSFESPSYLENVTKLVGTLGLEQQIADVERVRRILGQEKLTLIGHSFGGFLAALYAVEFPERVEKLVLVSPAEMLKLPSPDGGVFEAIKQALPEGEARQAYNDYLARFFMGFGSVFDRSEQELVALHREFARHFAAALAARGLPADGAAAPEGHDGGWMPFAIYFSLGMQYDHASFLSRVACPVLLLHGERDLASSPAGRALYREQLKNAAVQTFPDTGHFLFLERPQQFAEAVRGFLRSSSDSK